jgi:peptidoglycan/LPS O-acetylase OafA/YrhL
VSIAVYRSRGKRASSALIGRLFKQKTAMPPSEGSTGARPRSSLPALTGVRFFAAMQVVAFHFGAGFARRHGFSAPVQHLLDNGWVAVALFFILSGFILSYTYSHNITGRGSRARFWVARFARIYPVYLLSLLLDIPFTEATLPNKLAVLTMVQCWNPLRSWWSGAWNLPTWTLSCEAFFYLAFPFLLPAIQKVSNRILQGMAIALLLLIVFGHTMTNWPAAWLHTLWIPLPLLRLPEFLLGIAAGTLFLRNYRLSFGSVTATVTIAAILFIELTITGPWISLLVLPYILLIYSLAQEQGFWARILNAPALVFLGGASYAIYLLQMPVRSWTHVFLSGNHRIDGVDAFLSPLILIGFSCLVFRYLEEPTRRWIKKVFTGNPRRSAATLVVPLNSSERL